MIPWGLERHYRRTGDLDFVAAVWPMIEQAAARLPAATRAIPGLRWLEDLNLISSAGIWDNRFGAFLYSNACVVAGLRAAARLAERARPAPSRRGRWQALADRIWEDGILRRASPATRRARAWSTRDGPVPRRPAALDPPRPLDRPARVARSTGRAALDISLLGPVVPFGLLPASDPRMRRTAEAILRHNAVRRRPERPDPLVGRPDAGPSRSRGAQRVAPARTSPAWRRSGWPAT